MGDTQSADLQKRHDAAMETVNRLQVKLDAALQKHKDDAEAHAIDKKAALEAQAQELSEQHNRRVESLKEKYLAPAMRDLQARQEEDLRKKCEADMAALRAE